MVGIIGKKVGMTSMFDENRQNIACTIIRAEPNVVTQLKTDEREGYESIQLAFDEKKEKRTSKAMQGHFKKSGTSPKRKLVEFRFKHTYLDEEIKVNLGDMVTVDIFDEGDFVDVVGTSKGKGFQGVVKRHGFRGVGQRTHGQHNRERAPGSLGAGSTPSCVLKGMKMGGRMGGQRVMVTNLQVLKVIPEKNLIVVSGAVPGHNGAYVIVEK